MARPVSVLLVITALASCGGGGGDGRSIPLSSNVTRLIQPGDLIEYQTRYSGTFDDGSGPVDVEVEGDQFNSYDNLADLVLGDSLKIGFTSFQATAQLVEVGRDITERVTGAQGADRSLYALSINNGDCFIDEATFDTVGAPLDSPGSYFVGFTYDRTFPMVCRGGETATYSNRFSVLDTEIVDTPLGSIEAFRVSYRSESRKTVPFSPDELLVQDGTVWVNPGIGGVKQIGTFIQQNRAGRSVFDIEVAIKSFNFDQ